jgi:hypothetical protein
MSDLNPILVRTARWLDNSHAQALLVLQKGERGERAWFSVSLSDLERLHRVIGRLIETHPSEGTAPETNQNVELT